MKTKPNSLNIGKLMLVVISLVFQQSRAQTEYLYQIGKKDSIYSKILNENRDIYIQLPDSYKSDSQEKYPVIFILDGDVLMPTLVNTHDYYSGGFMPEMVIVGISNSENRTRDLTPSKITTKYGMPFYEENGEAVNFLKFIETELIPYVEQHYPVTNYRTLIGHSYGGLFTIFTLINKPELFANYVSIDPSLDWDDQMVLKQAEKVFKEKSFEGKALYVSLSGQLHMQNQEVTIDNVMEDTSDYTLFARSNIMLSRIIEESPENNLSFKWQFYPNDLHGTIPQPSIKDGMISLFTWFQMENTDKFNAPDTPKDELKNMIEFRANKLENHFGYSVPPFPEDLLNGLGYMNIDMHQLDKSKLYFELAIKYYPKSANAYDSMADYYLATNNKKKALQMLALAYQLSGNTYYKERMQKLKIN
ncbi:putative esterase [Xanthomarina gelatinilytica]|uniref:Putative esterase n=1 Tax=Xanthomarina gelatinilytica TaxID=1137281 RepID=M7MNE5_9FLAO|nr:alpha/beta hydrolase-fold protein [Xanthomarina gelatinilytica]EMQ96475.1 putative esterase [Xanthomarina gelatinilytica]